MPKSKEEKDQERDAKLLVLIAGALAIGAPPAATAASLATVLGFPIAVLLPVLKIAMARPMSYGIATLPSATATGESSALEAEYRAAYVLAASRRLQGLSGDALDAALRRERTYFNQHLDAMKKRKTAARDVDLARAKYGDELGWYAKMDSRTSDECREANGRNFNATRIPGIGWPGAVHPHCRCKPGRRHATSQTVYSVKPRVA